MVFSILLILIGIGIILNHAGVIVGDVWTYIFGALFIIIGLVFVFKKNKCCTPKKEG